MKECTGPKGGLGLPFYRRWLNHRNSVTNPAELIPSAGRDISTDKNRCQILDAGCQKKFSDIRYLTSGICILCESNVASVARLRLFDRGAYLEQAVKHLCALGAARRELGIGLFVQTL